VWIETISITGFDRGPYSHCAHLFHSEVFNNLVYPKGSNPHPSPAFTLLFTFIASLLPHFVFLSNLSGNRAIKQKLSQVMATYGSDGPSVLNKQ